MRASLRAIIDVGRRIRASLYYYIIDVLDAAKQEETQVSCFYVFLLERAKRAITREEEELATTTNVNDQLVNSLIIDYHRLWALREQGLCLRPLAFARYNNNNIRLNHARTCRQENSINLVFLTFTLSHFFRHARRFIMRP